MTKWQTRQALYLLGLTGILYLFSCKSQVIKRKDASVNVRVNCKADIVEHAAVLSGITHSASGDTGHFFKENKVYL